MKRIGVFGGTFNPVHNGHIRLAQAYISQLALDLLVVIPTYQPPHKQASQLVSGVHRLRMCRLAFGSMSNCVVSDFEVTRAEKSYTVNTLEQLHKEFAQDRLYLLMGSDMFLTFTQWRDWQRILQLAVICVGMREPQLHSEIISQSAALAQAGAECRTIALEPLVLSSTQVREQIVQGKNFHSFVPSAVADYIEHNRLYL